MKRFRDFNIEIGDLVMMKYPLSILTFEGGKLGDADKDCFAVVVEMGEINEDACIYEIGVIVNGMFGFAPLDGLDIID